MLWALKSALGVLVPLESSVFLHFQSVIAGKGMMFLLEHKSAGFSGRISSDPKGI